MIAGFHGLTVDLPSLRREFNPSVRGTTLRSLINAADRLGFATRAVRAPLSRLDGLAMPAILHWNLNHYVVLERVRGGQALVHNPDGTSRWMPLSEVSNHFTGVALELRPALGFEPADHRQVVRLRHLWRRMTGLKRALLQTLALSAVMQAFALTLPYYTQIAVDQVLPATDWGLLATLGLGFGLFALANAVASALRSLVLMSAGASLGFGVSTNIARRLFRLPIPWFEKRHVGDVLSRFQSVGPIQQAMTQGTITVMLDGLLAVITLGLMAVYSIPLSLVAITAVAMYVAVRAISFSYEREARAEVIVASAKEQSTLIETLRGMTALRMYNSEASRNALWQSRLADATNAGIGMSRIGILQAAANNAIFGIEAVAAIWIAIASVLSGSLSLGMALAYFAYKTQFISRVSSLVDQSIAFRMLALHLERLSDIVVAEEDTTLTTLPVARRRLDGRIELKAIHYRYGRDDPPVLKGLDLTVEPGDHVAITGPSGGGKSTLVKLLLGLAQPDSGDIIVDGAPIETFGFANYRSQVGAVLQGDSLFSGTIAENIALFDDEIDMDRVIAAARAAAFEDDVNMLPMGYDTLVGDMGSALSGGQVQRVLLARALYRQPRLLVIDEGTSHLDPERERLVNEAIQLMGVTRIVIAHRPETVRAAARSYRLHDGRLVEISDKVNAFSADDGAH